ncbi:MAG TPA: glycosyltransferase family 2 protein [Verrucomicrobiae bacterium]|nr:glycosyltransferase family 2 protein [Verrucomicrobiae bacterium]
MSKACVVIPNWNGADSLAACLDSLLKQSEKPHMIVVDNGSTDGSLELLEKYPEVEVIKHVENRGYAGGMNPGLQRAIDSGAEYVAAFNNDAVADKRWLRELVQALDKQPEAGIATCKLLSADGKHIDSTGDYFTVWGLPYPRGRGETDLTKYDTQTEIFGASGGASLYRVSLLQEVGLFDEDFFAYYEDVDLSFRTQLAGWKVVYVPSAVAYHQISATSNRLKGFATYQTMKNQPLLVYKNVPRRYLFRVGWRFTLAHVLFYLRAFTRGQGWMATKGDLKGTNLLFKKAKERRRIQRTKKVSDEYIWSIMVHDLPPNARNLRKLRDAWWKLLRKRV